ncbi:MAG: hypothetical protein ACLPXZ_12670, partial [Mycobacterium sp.]
GDYAAAGMLATFAWVDTAAVSGNSVAATLVRDRGSQPVVLQQLLTAQRYERIRLVVPVPLDAPQDARVPLAAEQALEQMARSASMGAQITLLRLLITADPSPRSRWRSVTAAPTIWTRWRWFRSRRRGRSDRRRVGHAPTGG